jgi:hypothetical protein
MADLSDEEIAELRELDAKATKRWTADVGTIHATDIDGIISGPEERLLQDEGLQSDIDVAVAARNALPRLLAEIERRRVQELLDAPETPEEKAALDKLPSDPERILARGRARLLAHEQGRKK